MATNIKQWTIPLNLSTRKVMTRIKLKGNGDKWKSAYGRMAEKRNIILLTLRNNTGRFANESLRQRPVRQGMKSIRQSQNYVSSPTQGHFYPYTHINYSSFFIQHRAKQTAKYVYPELNAIQLIPRSFIHCQAKRKSIHLDIGSRSDWHISVQLANWHPTLANRLHTLANWLVGERREKLVSWTTTTQATFLLPYKKNPFFLYTGAFNMRTDLNFSQLTEFIICASAATFMISNKTDQGKSSGWK